MALVKNDDGYIWEPDPPADAGTTGLSFDQLLQQFKSGQIPTGTLQTLGYRQDGNGGWNYNGKSVTPENDPNSGYQGYDRRLGIRAEDYRPGENDPKDDSSLHYAELNGLPLDYSQWTPQDNANYAQWRAATFPSADPLAPFKDLATNIGRAASVYGAVSGLGGLASSLGSSAASTGGAGADAVTGGAGAGAGGGGGGSLLGTPQEWQTLGEQLGSGASAAGAGGVTFDPNAGAGAGAGTTLSTGGTATGATGALGGLTTGQTVSGVGAAASAAGGAGAAGGASPATDEFGNVIDNTGAVPATPQDVTQQTIGAATVPAATSAASQSAWQRIINGSTDPADYATALGQAIPGLLGAYSSSQQTGALQDIANQQIAQRKPFLDKATQYLNNPASFYSTPEAGAAGDALLRKLSVNGNPASNPTSLAAATSGLYGNYQGALTGLANLGLSGQSGIVGAQTNAVNQSGQTAADLGSAVSSVVNPQQSLTQLLRQLGGNLNFSGTSLQ